jgi:hypothetical protein
MVADEVDFRAQAAVGTSERMVVGLRPIRIPFFLAPAACWWARQTVESTDTVQPMPSASSAAARSTARTDPFPGPVYGHLINRL